MYVSSNESDESSDSSISSYPIGKTAGATGITRHVGTSAAEFLDSIGYVEPKGSEGSTGAFGPIGTKGFKSYTYSSDESSDEIPYKSTNKKVYAQNYDSHSPDILELPETLDSIQAGNYSLKVSNRMIRIIYGFEFGSIVLILILYSFWAFKWTNIGDQMAQILQTQNPRYIAVIAVGAISWAIVYFALVGASIYNRKDRIRSQKQLILYSLIAGAHVIYHLVRWPIFAALIISSGTLVSSNESEESDSLEVLESRVIMTFWFDFVTLLCVALILSFGYACHSDWDKCCNCC